MTLTKPFLLFLLLSLSLYSHSQKTGIIRFAIEVDNGYFEIFLNDTLLEKRYKDTLPVGHYEGTIWSPTYKTKDISFDILEGDNGKFHTKLEHNEAYYEDIKASINYDKKRNLYKRLPVFLIVTGLITSGVVYPFLSKSRDIIDDRISRYSELSLPSYIRNFKTSFIQYENQYNTRRAIFYSGIGISCSAFVASFFSFRYFNRNFSYSNLKETSPWADRFSFYFTGSSTGFIIKI